MSKCSAKNRRCAGGDEWCIGGTLRIEDGATLDVAEGATVNGLAAGGGAFVVNFTIDYDTGTVSVDKTTAEIKQAWLAGKQIVGKQRVEMHGVVAYSDVPFSSYGSMEDTETVTFSVVALTGNNEATLSVIQIKSDGTVMTKNLRLAERVE